MHLCKGVIIYLEKQKIPKYIVGPSWRVDIPSALDQMSVSHNINKCNKCSQFEYMQPGSKLVWGNMKTHNGEMRNAPIAIIDGLLIQVTFRPHLKTHTG